MIVVLSHNDNVLLIAALLGFGVVVVFLHLVEAVTCALRLRRWDVAAIGFVCLLMIGGGGVWLVVQRLHVGIRLPDLLALLGSQMALAVCLPARWLRRRVCQWERYRTLNATSNLPSHPGQLRPPGRWPLHHRHTPPISRFVGGARHTR